VADLLTIDDFKDKQGDAFFLAVGPEANLEVVLVSVSATRTAQFPGKQRDPFSLIFEGTKGTYCQQGTYTVRHGSGWTVDMFLVPIGGKPDGTFKYQAVYT
jgi:hypothetical protein